MHLRNGAEVEIERVWPLAFGHDLAPVEVKLHAGDPFAGDNGLNVLKAAEELVRQRCDPQTWSGALELFLDGRQGRGRLQLLPLGLRAVGNLRHGEIGFQDRLGVGIEIRNLEPRLVLARPEDAIDHNAQPLGLDGGGVVEAVAKAFEEVLVLQHLAHDVEAVQPHTSDVLQGQRSLRHEHSQLRGRPIALSGGVAYRQLRRQRLGAAGRHDDRVEDLAGLLRVDGARLEELHIIEAPSPDGLDGSHDVVGVMTLLLQMSHRGALDQAEYALQRPGLVALYGHHSSRNQVIERVVAGAIRLPEYVVDAFAGHVEQKLRTLGEAGHIDECPDLERLQKLTAVRDEDLGGLAVDQIGAGAVGYGRPVACFRGLQSIVVKLFE